MISAQSIRHSRVVSRSPIFYGLVVWLIATYGIMATSPGQSFTVSLFFDYFINEFGLDRTTVSSLYGLGTFIGALSLTWVGRLIDEYGNRRIGAAVSVLFAISLVLFSTITGPLGLLLGFISIRGLGQGSLSLVNSTVIAQWFIRRRGRMMSFTLVFFALFQSAYVLWLQDLLERMEWREVWIILGVWVALLVFPFIALLIRNTPEEFGLKPDGESIPGVSLKDTVEEAAEEDNWTLREAMRTPIFWVFIGGRLLPPAWGTGLILHQVSIFTELGYAPQVAAETFASVAIFTAIFAISGGYLVDRFRPGLVMVLQLSALVIAMALAMVMRSSWMLVIYAAAFGLSNGTGGVFDGAVWANLFGRKYQGTIRGFNTTAMVIGSAIGPILFGVSFDSFGGYSPVLYMGIVLALIAIVFSFRTSPPRKS